MRGFSLIEVLAAFVILALVATALFRLFSASLNNASASEEWSRALQVAESQLEVAARGGGKVPRTALRLFRWPREPRVKTRTSGATLAA